MAETRPVIDDPKGLDRDRRDDTRRGASMAGVGEWLDGG